MSDVPAVSVADAFMIKVEDTYYMFFEVVNLITWHGEIGLATGPSSQQLALRFYYASVLAPKSSGHIGPYFVGVLTGIRQLQS